MRSGIIVKKIGMSRSFSQDGVNTPVTVLKLENVQVISVMSNEKNGYTAVQVGAGKAKLKNVSKPMKGHFSKSKIEPKQIIKEFIVSEEMILKEGDTFSASHFVVGQKIDATGISIGKGFSGAMKRHNFSGLRASHGVSISHRSHGSTGNSQDPGKVWKGKKMAGQNGNVPKTIQNLTIINVDIEEDLIFVKGSVPGAKNSYISLKDSIKHKLPENVEKPAGLRNSKTDNEEKQNDVAKNLENNDLSSNEAKINNTDEVNKTDLESKQMDNNDSNENPASKEAKTTEKNNQETLGENKE